MTPRIGVKGEERLEDRNEKRTRRRGIVEIEGGVAWARITPVAIKDVRAVNSAKDKFSRRYISIPLNSFFPTFSIFLVLPSLSSSSSSSSFWFHHFARFLFRLVSLIALLDALQRRGLWSLQFHVHNADVVSFVPSSFFLLLLRLVLSCDHRLVYTWLLPSSIRERWKFSTTFSDIFQTTNSRFTGKRLNRFVNTCGYAGVIASEEHNRKYLPRVTNVVVATCYLIFALCTLDDIFSHAVAVTTESRSIRKENTLVRHDRFLSAQLHRSKRLLYGSVRCVWPRCAFKRLNVFSAERQNTFDKYVRQFYRTTMLSIILTVGRWKMNLFPKIHKHWDLVLISLLDLPS